MLKTKDLDQHLQPQVTAQPVHFIDPEGIAMIWRRDMDRLWRQRSRLYSAIVRALVWLFALGFGLRGSLQSINGFSYEQFVFPGVVAMTIIFSGLQSAISIIYDREFGFLKEVLVAPTPRSTLVLGKCLGGATSATIQAAIVLCFAPLARVPLTLTSVPLTLLTMFVTALTLSSLGIVLAVSIKDFENFGTIQNFITLPLYLFSGAVFPAQHLPDWLHLILFLNPLTYGVSAIRSALLGYNLSAIPVNLSILLLICLVFLALAILLTRREA